ncbi:hypothetical protein EBR16_09040, partial [bacterium]|nr:hypothetical protein [bacterium]
MRLVADQAFPLTETYVRRRIGATATGPTTLRLVKAEKHGDFAFGPEGYAIVNEPGKDLIIEAATEAGAFYAFHTLDQLSYAGSDGQRYVRPGLLLDRPRFAWRGVMIDEGRHFLGKEPVKRMLHLMSLYKLNVLHWHLTEDQGWRVEIKKWPALRRLLHAGGPQGNRRLRRPTPHHHRPGDRHAGPLQRRHRGLPGARQHRHPGLRAEGGRQLGREILHARPEGGDLPLHRRRLRRTLPDLPRRLLPRGRRRGPQGPVEQVRLREVRHGPRKAEGCARAAGLLHRPPGEDAAGARQEADRLGRDPGRRPLEVGHDDGLARLEMGPARRRARQPHRDGPHLPHLFRLRPGQAAR